MLLFTYIVIDNCLYNICVDVYTHRAMLHSILRSVNTGLTHQATPPSYVTSANNTQPSINIYIHRYLKVYYFVYIHICYYMSFFNKKYTLLSFIS